MIDEVNQSWARGYENTAFIFYPGCGSSQTHEVVTFKLNGIHTTSRGWPRDVDVFICKI